MAKKGKKTTLSTTAKKTATQNKKATPSKPTKTEPTKHSPNEPKISAEQLASIMVASGQATYFTVGQNHGHALRRLWDALWPDLVAEAVRRETSGEALADRDMLKRWQAWTKRDLPGTHGDWKYIAHWCGIAIPPTVTDEWIDNDLQPAMVFKQHANARQIVELRKQHIHRQLAVKTHRARLEYLLDKTLAFLVQNHNNIFDDDLHTLAREIREDVGVICFEPRINRQRFWLPWSEWSCGGFAIEPSCPLLVMVDPHRGTARRRCIVGRERDEIVEQDVLNEVGDELRLCIQDWRKFSRSIDATEVNAPGNSQSQDEYVELTKAQLREILGKRVPVMVDRKEVRSGKITPMPESTFRDWINHGYIPFREKKHLTLTVPASWVAERTRLRDQSLQE